MRLEGHQGRGNGCCGDDGHLNAGATEVPVEDGLTDVPDTTDQLSEGEEAPPQEEAQQEQARLPRHSVPYHSHFQ